jgi:hypothetical protein
VHDEFDDARLERLNTYYRFIDEFGMHAGSPKVLTMILGRPPTSFAEFAQQLATR